MSASPAIECELARIRSDPRYGIDGADRDLLQRELELLILQVCAFEAEGALRRRKRKRHPGWAAPRADSASRTSS
jgi:hypothetical protein